MKKITEMNPINSNGKSFQKVGNRVTMYTLTIDSRAEKEVHR